MYVLYSDINQLRAKDESQYYKYNNTFQQYRYSYIITNKVIIRGSISLSWREAYLVKISTSSKKVSQRNSSERSHGKVFHCEHDNVPMCAVADTNFCSVFTRGVYAHIAMRSIRNNSRGSYYFVCQKFQQNVYTCGFYSRTAIIKPVSPIAFCQN